MPTLAPQADFPGLQQLTYLNSASVAVTPLPVMREVLAFESQIASQGTVSFDDAAESRVYDGARTSVAQLLHANTDDIAMMTSATECLLQVAWWLKPGRGKNVVSIDIEFPSVTYPWLRVAQDTGCEVRLAKVQTDPASLSFDSVERLVDKNTAVICVSHVQYASGHRLDPVKLAGLAQAHNAMLVLDATQSAGVLPLDVRHAKFHFVLSSAYKWLCGPFGAAFCYMYPEVWREFNPPFVGYHSTPVPFEFDATRIDLAAAARRMEYATVAYSAGLGMAAAIKYLDNLGISEIMAHDLHLAGMLMAGLEKLGAEIITPREDAGRAGIVCARFAGRPAGSIVSALRERGIVCASRLEAVRFAPHIFNSEEHVERCLHELTRLLGKG
jgi:cysteine desulfurase / selenocysteine lyase